MGAADAWPQEPVSLLIAWSLSSLPACTRRTWSQTSGAASSWPQRASTLTVAAAVKNWSAISVLGNGNTCGHMCASVLRLYPEGIAVGGPSPVAHAC